MNLFKNAYFGKVYKTRGDRKAIYLGYTNNSIYHICFVEGESNIGLYFSNGDEWGHRDKGMSRNDIVSEWEETIDENELDNLDEECECEYTEQDYEKIKNTHNNERKEVVIKYCQSRIYGK